MSKKRVQVGNLREAQQLRPAASPVDTFVSPAVDQGVGSNIGQLANALRGIEPAVGAYMDNVHNAHVQRMQGLAEGRIDGLSLEEAMQMRKEGTLAENSDPWYQAALDQHYGKKLAESTFNKMTESIQGYGVDPIDALQMDDGQLDQWISAQSTAAMEGLDMGGTAANAYRRQMEQARNTLFDYADKAKQGEWRRQAFEAAGENLLGIVADGKSAGMSPSDIHRKMRGAFKTNGALYRLSTGDQEEVMLGLAAQLSQKGDVEMVKEILYGNRQLDNGNKIGPIGNTQVHAAKSASILENAQKEHIQQSRIDNFNLRVEWKDLAQQGTLDEVQFKEYNKLNPNAFTQAEEEQVILQNRRTIETARAKASFADAYMAQEQQIDRSLQQLIDNGTIHQLQSFSGINKNGIEKEFTTKMLRDRAVDMIVNQPRRSDEPPAMYYKRIIDQLHINGLEHPTWRETFKTGAVATSQSVLANGKIAPATNDALNTYRALKSVAPQYLAGLIDKDVAAYYHLIDTAVSQNGETVEQAVASVTGILQGMDNDQRVKLRDLRYTKLENALEDTKDISGWNPDIAPGADKVLESLAHYYIDKGMDSQQALDAAVKRIHDTHAVVNDTYVDVSGLPSTFPKAAEEMLTKVAADNQLDVDEVMITPLNTTKTAWGVQYKSTRNYLKVNGKYLMSSDEIDGYLQAARRADIQRQVDDNNQLNRAHYERSDVNGLFDSLNAVP